MGFFSRLFWKKQLNATKISFPEFAQAENFNFELQKLLSLDSFLARSNYMYLIDKYKSTYDFFQ